MSEPVICEIIVVQQEYFRRFSKVLIFFDFWYPSKVYLRFSEPLIEPLRKN